MPCHDPTTAIHPLISSLAPTAFLRTPHAHLMPPPLPLLQSSEYLLALQAIPRHLPDVALPACSMHIIKANPPSLYPLPFVLANILITVTHGMSPTAPFHLF